MPRRDFADGRWRTYLAAAARLVPHYGKPTNGALVAAKVLYKLATEGLHSIDGDESEPLPAAEAPPDDAFIMPDWFQHLAKNVLVFCNGYKHHGTAWGEQDELEPNVIHVTTSRGGIYNVMVTADRNDHCATTMCPQEVEYTPSPPQAAPQGFPST